MTAIDGPEVRPAGPHEIDAVADVLGEAFADSPWTRWTVAADDRPARVRSLQRVALELIGFDHGEVWVACVGDDVVGAAVFSDSRAPAPDPVVRDLHERSAGLAGDRAEASMAAHDATSALVPRFAHLSLDVVGVRVAHQGGGVGTAVLGPGLGEADRTALPVRLETAKAENVRFYERFGFEVTDHLDLGGIEVWAMLRPPT